MKKENLPSSFRNFDWEKAKTFYYIAHYKSFTRASENLHLSQPALSRQIASLEQSIGMSLFIRGAKGLTLTRKGEELLAIIQETFGELSIFYNKDKTAVRRGDARTLRIGIERGLEYLVVGQVESYQHANPNLTFEIMLDMPTQSPRILDLDIAICRTKTNFPDCCVYLLFHLESRISFGKTMTISGSKDSLKRIYAIMPDHLKDDEEISLIRQLLTKEDD